MKTSIKTLIASSLTAVVLSSALFITNVYATEKSPVKISTASGFKRVSVKGNVEILLIQRKTEGITYSDDNTGTAKITQQGNILRISSVDKNVTKLIVYVNDLFRIEASENTVIKTEDKLVTKYLQVFLKGNARVELNTRTEGLYTVLKDNSELKLSGSTDNHNLVMEKTPKLTIDRFAALKTNISSEESYYAVEKEMASINK